MEKIPEKMSADLHRTLYSYSKKAHRQIKAIGEILRSIRRDPRGLIGVSIVTAIIICAVFAPWIAPHGPYEQNIANRFAGPSFEHWLGTDYVGRDILSRMIYGARVAIIVSFGSVMLAVVVGVPWGAFAAYSGKTLDLMTILIFDIIRSFPQIILILVLVAVVGPSLSHIIFVLAFTSMPAYGRVARAEALSVKEEEYTVAAKSLGAGTGRILFNHIIPNILTPIIVLAGMDLAVMIMYESGLSFLGMGVRPPAASWGIMLRQGYTYISTSPWMIIWPSVVLAMAMLGFSLLAESLRGSLNPQERD